jgi:PAS domain S-box-containing protein
MRINSASPGLPSLIQVKACRIREIFAVGVAEEPVDQTNQPRRNIEEQLGPFRLLMNHCVDGMVIIDGAGTVMAFNASAEKIFGYAAAEIEGRNVSMLMPDPDRGRHDAYIRNYIETGVAKIIGIGREVVGRRKDGSVFPMDLSVGEIPCDERRCFVGTIRDITERRNIERQLLQASKMEAVGQLTGGIAHDFNNLLAILMMDLEILEQSCRGDAEKLELVSEALDVTRAGADLTQRLLAFSRRQSLVPTQIDVGDLVASATGLLKRTLGEEIEICASGISDLWPISADRGQLESAILNLAINARDAMPKGGALSIRGENVTIDRADASNFDELEPGRYVRLSITDTGTGMPPDIVSRVIEPFFTTKEGGHGTGLGLSMVYGFVRQSGGQLTIYSEVGVGTTVNLYFPRDRSAPEANGAVAPVEDLPTGTERVLLVEDDNRLRDRTERALAALGYRVETAVNGVAALEVLSRGALPDLLLSDVVMPGGTTGIAVVEEAWKRHPRLPVILMTGYAENSEALAESANRGALVLHKPFTRRQLAETVRRALG